jgi:hypothetical protein
MKIGYKVVNEFNNHTPVYYCGGCLDTHTGVEDMWSNDGIQQCMYCKDPITNYEDSFVAREETAGTKPKWVQSQLNDREVYVVTSVTSRHPERYQACGNERDGFTVYDHNIPGTICDDYGTPITFEFEASAVLMACVMNERS